MIRKDNRGTVSLSKKGWIILFGSVLAVALAAWIILVAGIFRNKNRNDKDKGHGYNLPEIPEGYALVFRIKTIYRGSENGQKDISCDCEYDDFGRLITKKIYRFGTFSSRFQYAYDDFGNMIRKTKYDDKGYFLSNTENEYDSEGRLRKTHTDDTVKTFNENGDLLLECETGGDDGHAVKYIKECVYTDDGRILSETDYKTEQVTAYFYDNSGKKERVETRSHGNLISEEIFLTKYTSEYYAFTDDGVRKLKTKSEYDENGKCINLTEYNEDGTVLRNKLTEWEEHGFPVKELVYENGVLTAWTEYEYDVEPFMFTSKATEKYPDGWAKSYTAECGLLGIENMDDLRASSYSTLESSFRWEQDFYGNPVRCIRLSRGEESVMYDLEFIPMAIPKEYMNDYDRYEKK